MGTMPRLRALEDQAKAGVAPFNLNNAFYVDPINGSNSSSGRKSTAAKLTLTSALEAVDLLGQQNWGIFVAPGQLDESPTIARTLPPGGCIIGSGGRGSAFIDPSTEDADGLTVHQDDITLINLGCAAEDTTAGNRALQVSGSRFRAYGCKFEGGESQIVLGPGTVALEAADTWGRGGDMLFDDCEICWGTNGVEILCTDFGALTQAFFDNCRFHNLATKHLKETVGSGGSAAVMFTNLQIRNCVFDRDEAAAEPATGYIVLNGNNANGGIVTGCRFPTALNGGKNLVSTKLFWIGNYHTAGIGGAQPS